MKDGPESAEHVKTAVSATNGGSGSNGDLLSPLSRDKTLNHAVAQSKQQAAAEGLVAIGAEDVVAAGDNGIPLTSLLQRSSDVEAVVPDTNGDTITDSVSVANGSNSSINDDDDDKSSNNGNKSDSGNKNSNGDKVFICSICSRCFGYKHVLQNHERTHTGEKPFECPECHKRFTRDHHLKTHMRLHTGEKPYQCSHCDRHFVQVANLRRHLRVHTGERPYACQSCTSKFSDSNQLKAHMLIHRGEKPFQCTECLGRFRRRHHLIHHKCPKDEANVGKPRRGRRPKAYDHQLRPDDEDDALHMTTDNEEDEVDHLLQNHRHIIVNNHNNHNKNHRNNNHHSPSELDHQQQVNSPQVLPVWNNIATTKTSGMVNGNSHNRKHPNHAISILTPQQRELFLRDKVTMQTQAIDMRVSAEITPIRTVIVPTRSSRFVEGVLDLSSSRSDSEIEPIEEVEVEIQRDDEDDLVEVDDDLVDVVNGGDNHHCHDDFDDNSCGSHHNHHVRSVVKTLTTFNGLRTDPPSSPIVVSNHNHNNHHNNHHHIRPSVLVGKVVEPVNGISYNSDEIRLNMRINGHKVSNDGEDARQRNNISPHPLPLTKKASIATA